MSAAAVALVPVLLFLALLFAMDSFKLVRPQALAVAMGGGAVGALVAMPLTTLMAARLGLTPGQVVRYAAPLVEEPLKLAVIGYLLHRRRIGFPVDAAVLGFGAGAGFALVENLVFLGAMPGAPFLLWLVRGIGTAVLHGATTAIAAIVACAFSARSGNVPRGLFVGVAAAAALHACYNQLVLPPLLGALVVLLVFPALVLVVFERSERATREWVGAGLDLDVELLGIFASDQFPTTRFGRYLEQLRGRFPGPVVVDMFCLLRLEVELSVQAKARLLAREAGLEMEPHPDIAAGLRELHALRASIGPTGMLALAPLHVTSPRDEWHRYVVSE
ncbi:MAG: PrsW family intramembrane metalloprotease [Acidobacteria bacterium]|nr:PrsW family intramembrane metalloprotease [Acidobacteriota bacterium]